MVMSEGLNNRQAVIKRSFDVMLALLMLLVSWWLILLAFCLASIDTRSNGFFMQVRVGKDGKLFKVVKIKTMRPQINVSTTVTTSLDPRITPLGRLLRKTKIDELPQLYNVLKGDMSFVGPRPDVPGFSDMLVGESRLMLSIRPGITGPATLKYRNEEELLAVQQNPEAYNRDVIFPDKVKINIAYVRDWRLSKDIQYIWQTAVG
jgi:lipopolysaccharide/colanic/teichoic acid biosynthesis glycosyltransferase